MKKLTLIALTAALILSCFSYLQSQQTGKVTGTVTDSRTGRAISGAAVNILNSQFSTLTDNQGKYLISNVPATARNTITLQHENSQKNLKNVALSYRQVLV